MAARDARCPPGRGRRGVFHSGRELHGRAADTKKKEKHRPGGGSAPTDEDLWIVGRHEGVRIASVHEDESLDWELLPGRLDPLAIPRDPHVRRELESWLPGLPDVRRSDGSGKPLAPFQTAAEEIASRLQNARASAEGAADNFLFPKQYLDRATDLPFCRAATSRLDSEYTRAVIAMKLAEDFYQKARPASADLADLKRRSSREGINIRWSPSFQKEELALGFELDILRRAAASVADAKVAKALDQRARKLEGELEKVGRATAPPGRSGRRRETNLRGVLRTAKRRIRLLDRAGWAAALKACGWEDVTTKELRDLNVEEVALCLIGADRFRWTQEDMRNEKSRTALREVIMGRAEGLTGRGPSTPTK